MLWSRASFVGLAMISVLVVMIVVGLGNSLRDGFPSLNLPELMLSLEDLWRNYRSSVFFQHPFVTAMFGLLVLGIPILLATVYGITLHTFYSRCVLNSSSLSVTQFILLLARSLIAFPVAATLMLLAMSWQMVRKVSFSLRAWYSLEIQPAWRLKNLTFMSALQEDSLWYLLFPWPGYCTLSYGRSNTRSSPITSDRLLCWLAICLCILTGIAYLGPDIVLHQTPRIRGGPFVERHAFNIIFWIHASLFLGDYLVVTFRVVPFLKAQSAEHKRTPE